MHYLAVGSVFQPHMLIMDFLQTLLQLTARSLSHCAQNIAPVAERSSIPSPFAIAPASACKTKALQAFKAPSSSRNARSSRANGSIYLCAGSCELRIFFNCSGHFA
jgi:hypothetical protein